jgi:hypothetical protein
MSQGGGYGSGGGGGYGPPPGNGPPPGGYGPPPGGYGPPPGGPDGFGPSGPFGPPPLGAPGSGIGRLGKYAAVGGVIGGVLSSIPVLNVLNCCFCLLVVAGVATGISLHLSANPEDSLNAGESAAFGGISGAISGLVAGLLGTLLSMLMSGFLLGMSKDLPPELGKQIAMQGGMGLLAIPVYAVIFGVFGALGGFLTMQVAFKHRLRP